MCRRSSYSLSVPVCVLAVFLAVLLGYPGGIRAACHDIVAYNSNSQTLDAEKAAHEGFSARSVAINARIQIKDGLIEELIAGRTTLVEVTTRFEQMNADVPATVLVLESKYPGLPSDRRSARNVIDFVRLRLASDSSERDDILARLERDYEVAFGGPYVVRVAV